MTSFNLWIEQMIAIRINWLKIKINQQKFNKKKNKYQNQIFKHFKVVTKLGIFDNIRNHYFCAQLKFQKGFFYARQNY